MRENKPEDEACSVHLNQGYCSGCVSCASIYIATLEHVNELLEKDRESQALILMDLKKRLQGIAREASVL